MKGSSFVILALKNGEKRQTRNAITYSIFGNQLKFNLLDKFPILTTKKVFFRGIVEELNRIPKIVYVRGSSS